MRIVLLFDIYTLQINIFLNKKMKRRLLQQSLELATEIHQLMKDVPGEDSSNITEPINTLSLTVQSHLVRGQKQESEELGNSLALSRVALSELEAKLLETVKLRKLKKMTINPTLAKIADLSGEIEVEIGRASCRERV